MSTGDTSAKHLVYPVVVTVPTNARSYAHQPHQPQPTSPQLELQTLIPPTPQHIKPSIPIHPAIHPSTYNGNSHSPPRISVLPTPSPANPHSPEAPPCPRTYTHSRRYIMLSHHGCLAAVLHLRVSAISGTRVGASIRMSIAYVCGEEGLLRGGG